jgi:hypothetical protein
VYAAVKYFQPSLIFAGKPSNYTTTGHIEVFHLGHTCKCKKRLLLLAINKHSSLVSISVWGKEKSTMKLTAAVVSQDFQGRFQKTFFFVTHQWTTKARVFFPSRLFQPSVMFMSNAGAYSSGL